MVFRDARRMAGLGTAEPIPNHEASLWKTRLIPVEKARWIRGKSRPSRGEWTAGDASSARLSDLTGGKRVETSDTSKELVFYADENAAGRKKVFG